MSDGSRNSFPEAQLSLEELGNFRESQQISESQETADAIKLRRDLSAALAVPMGCLLGRVPAMLKVVDDHVLFPFSPFWPRNRWIRVSRLESLVRVCFKFRGILQNKIVMMHIMPYLSPLDAHNIHGMVDNPGRIKNLSDVTLLDDDVEQGQCLPVQGRSGTLVLHDPEVPNDESAVLHLKFTVLNYGLLWSKALEYSQLIGSMAPAKALTSHLDHYLLQIMDDLATARAVNGEDHISNLEEKCEQSKRWLLLSLHNDGIDPHDSILAIDAELHEELYDLGYDPCYPKDRNTDAMKQLTENAVNTYMTQLENENGHHHVRSAREARWNVLAAEGLYDVEARRSESVKQLHDAAQVCKEKVVDIVSEMNAASSRPSLAGVFGRYERFM